MAQMTGSDLLRALLALTPEQRALPVETEGCDCDGDAGALEVTEASLYIRRDGEDHWPASWT